VTTPEDTYDPNYFPTSNQQQGPSPTGEGGDTGGLPTTAYFSTFRGASDWSKSKAILDNMFADPSIGLKVEKIIQQYPTVTRDIIAGLAVSGYLDADGGLIDAIVKKDATAQQNTSWWYQPWNGLKAVTRSAFVLAEDLYNVSPVMTIPRTGIRMSQGESFGGALDHALETTARRANRLKSMGFETDYGEGFLPSQEIVPQSDTFWEDVKALIHTGELGGTPEEQMLAAINQTKIDTLRTVGVNPYATTMATWRSTLLHKTLNDGTIVSTPYSPGAGIAIGFSSPGSKAFSMASGLLDTGFRFVMEPIDIPLDRGLQHLAKVKTIGGDAAMLRHGKQRIRNFMRDELRIDLYDGDLPSQPKADPGDVGTMEYQGLTTSRVYADDLPRIEISLDSQVSGFFGPKGVPDVYDMADPYHRGYAATGLSPQELDDALKAAGGENAQMFVTIEHEVIHDQVQGKWHRIVETVDADGVTRRYVDDMTVTKDTPDDLRKIIDQYDESFVPEYDRITGEMNDIVKQANEAAPITPELHDELIGKWNDLDVERSVLSEKALDLKKQVAEYAEVHASVQAVNNMLDGSWGMPELMAGARKKAGFMNDGWRPRVNVRTFFEWLNTKAGQRSMVAFTERYNDLDSVLAHAPGISLDDAFRIAHSNDRATITKIFQDSYSGVPRQAPQIGMFSDQMGRGLDAWSSTTKFGGGVMVQSAQRIARRMGASAGHNIMSLTDPMETMEAISNALKTANVSAERIYEIQKVAQNVRNTGMTGLRKVHQMVLDEIVGSAKLVGPDHAKQVQHIMDQWTLAEEANHLYWVNPTTGEARSLYHNGKKWVTIDNERVAVGRHGAMLEAQFSSTNLAIPNVRQIRRMSSQQRRIYERIRSWKNWDEVGNPYLPLGLESSGVMKIGDLAFGVWRDFALFRFGWAMRILPEEHLRMGAAGYSTMFTNPTDYFTMLTNNLDFILPGDKATLATIVADDQLGTAMLRDLKTGEAFNAGNADWTVTSVAANERLGWAGITRDSILVTNDEMGRKIAQLGPKEARAFFMTPEGKAIVKRVVLSAEKNSGMDKLMNVADLFDYIDAVDLKITEMGGGVGAFKEADGIWYDSYGKRLHAFDDETVFPNKKTLREFIAEKGGEKPLSKATRPELESMAANAAGYDIGLLDTQRKTIHIIKEGNGDFRTFMHTGEIDDIVVNPDMPFDELRAMDPKLKAAYENRGINMDNYQIQVPKDELIRPDRGKNFYNKTVDGFFKNFNAIPSTRMTRQPHFAQALGRNVAQSYAYAPADVRQAIDNFAANNPEFAEIFESGKRRFLKEYAIDEMPPVSIAEPDAVTLARANERDLKPLTDADDDPGRYMMVPGELHDGTMVLLTQAYWDLMEELGAVPLTKGKRRGLQNYGQDAWNAENLIFHGSPTYQHPFQKEWRGISRAESRINGELIQYDDIPALQAQVQGHIDDLEAHVATEKVNVIDVKNPYGDGTGGVANDYAMEGRIESYYDSVKILEGEKKKLANLGDEEWVHERILHLREEMEGVKGNAEELYIKQKGQPENFDPHKGGGQALGIERTLQYEGGAISPDVVGESRNVPWDTDGMTLVFDQRTYPEELTSYIDDIGDIEQFYSLKVFDLDGIDGFQEAWNTLGRNKMRIPISQEQAQVMEYMMNEMYERAANNWSARRAFDAGDDGLNLQPDEAYEMFGRLPKGRIEDLVQEEMYEASKLKQYTATERKVIKELGLGVDRGGFYAPTPALARSIKNKAQGKQFTVKTELPSGPENIVAYMRSQGVNLSDADAVNVAKLFNARDWRPHEIVVSNMDIKPIAAFPADMVPQMQKYGVTATSNSAVGDMAIVMDTLLEQAVENLDHFDDVPARKMFDNASQRSDRIQFKQDDMMAGKRIMERDAFYKVHSDEWSDYVPEPELKQMADSVDAYILDNPTHALGSMEYDGPTQYYDWSQWMASEKQRAFWYRVWNLAETGQIEAGQFGTYMTDFRRNFRVSDEFRLTDYDNPALDGMPSDYIPDQWWDWFTGTYHNEPNMTVARQNDLLNDYMRDNILAMERGQEEIVSNSLLVGQSPEISPEIARQYGNMDIEIVDDLYVWRDKLDGKTTEELDALYPSKDAKGWRRQIDDKIRILYRSLEEAGLEPGFNKYMILHPTIEKGVEEIMERVDSLITEVQGRFALHVDVNTKAVPFDQRQEAVQRIFGHENYRYQWMETGHPQQTLPPGQRWANAGGKELETASEVEQIMKASKAAALEETRDLFYDLANKSNIADSLKFIFPFGDAWYEVLSRWAKIMNPMEHGSQPARNLRRLSVGVNAGRSSGFLSTNEYGEEVMNWPGLGALVPGLEGTGVGMSTSMPISSLMFIDPTARGVAGPSMSPWVQLSARMAQPTLDNLPALRDISNYIVYGGAEEYQPGKIENTGDVLGMFMPTPIRRMWAAVFDDSNREVYGNTKMRLFESLLATGDPRFASHDPEGMREAWRIANDAGTWLSVLRIFDSFIMPGQPQYSVEIQRAIDPRAPIGQQTLSLVSMANEYRHANELWGRAEADLYMVERYGVNPVVLQSMSSALVEYPATWDAVNFFAANEWILEESPLTAGFAVPIEDDSFSHRAWQDQFGTPVKIDGVEGANVREARTAQEIMGRIARSSGYEMLRFQDAMRDKQVEALKAAYGPNHERSSEYQLKKDAVLRTHQQNRAIIMTQFPAVESQNAGDVVSERTSASGNMMLLEVKDVGTVGSSANSAYRENMPEIADVAETFTRWFNTLDGISTDRGAMTGSVAWWQRAESPEAKQYMKMLVNSAEDYIKTLTDPGAKEYATFIAKRIIDPLSKDWEWMSAEFAPQLESYPTLLSEGISPSGRP
jgi:hypothetical protein